MALAFRAKRADINQMLRIISVLALIIAPSFCVADDLTGTVRIVDGDTLDLSGTRIRLHGVDAPETDQFCGSANAPMWACGAWVTRQVQARFNGQVARCMPVDMDRYGRVVAKCQVQGKDIGAELVQDGLAFAYREYSWDYDLAEKQAAVAGRGLHAAGVQSPKAFRAAGQRGLAAAALQDAPDGCVIKGNISANGKRIYHMPGQRWYARTRISTAKGERWFCSVAEAQSAGWRRAAQ